MAMILKLSGGIRCGYKRGRGHPHGHPMGETASPGPEHGLFSSRTCGSEPVSGNGHGGFGGFMLVSDKHFFSLRNCCVL